MPTSSSYVGPAGTSAGHANQPQWERAPVYEMRKKSIFGAMSQSIKGVTRSDDPGNPDIDPSKSAAVLYKSFEVGDKANWTMQKRVKAGPIFGEQQPPKGPAFEFLHTELSLGIVKTKAIPHMTVLNKMRLNSTTEFDDQKAVNAAITDMHGMFYAHDHYKAFLCGASDNVLASLADGGLAKDLGRGIGKRVSPLNAIVRGTGVIGGATLDARESNLKSALGSLSTANADHLLSIAALHELNEEIATGRANFEGIDMGGKEGFIVALPTIARLALGTELAAYAKENTALAEGHWLLQYRPVNIGKLSIVFDDGLSRYAPDVSGSEIVWGSDSTNPYDWEYADLTTAQKSRGLGLVFGASALRTAQAKAMKFTTETERHDTGKETSALTYRSIVRTMWRDMQDSAVMPFDQSALLWAFAVKPIKHGAA